MDPSRPRFLSLLLKILFLLVIYKKNIGVHCWINKTSKTSNNYIFQYLLLM